jgi:Mg-chelatase subunit ChlD
MKELSGGRSKLDAAVGACRVLLEQLRFDRGDRAALVTFGDSARVLHRLTSNRSAIDSAFGRVTVSQQTRIDKGIEAAHAELLMVRGTSRNVPVIVLLTDGKANPVPPGVAIVRADAAKRDGITVFTVGLGSDLDYDALATMASHPAFFFHAPTPAQLESIYRQIAGEIPCPPDQYWGRR